MPTTFVATLGMVFLDPVCIAAKRRDGGHKADTGGHSASVMTVTDGCSHFGTPRPTLGQWLNWTVCDDYNVSREEKKDVRLKE
jgi:hypothetical protein